MVGLPPFVVELRGHKGSRMARGRSRVPHFGGGEIAATQSATTGYEAKLWAMADALRGSMDAAEYKHVVLGLAWRCEKGAGAYADVPGICKSAALEEVRKHGHVLTPGRYVGAPPQEDNGEPFEDKMTRLVKQLRVQQAEGARLDKAIAANLEALGFGDGGS